MTATIDDEFGAAADAVAELVDRAGRLPAIVEDAERWPHVVAAARRLRDRHFLIAVCGEFSSGKSTLLGALLGRPELFPTAVGASTSVPTVVTWGESEQIVVVTTSESAGTAIGAPELPRYVTQAGNPDNVLHVTEVRITLPHPVLRNGIGFVDLPGLGSTRAAHAVVTNSYLERIDAALFVSAAQTVGESEVEFLRRVAGRVGDALVIARNKADLVMAVHGEAGVERAVADIRKKAAVALGVDGERLVVVPVSAMVHQLALGDPDEVAASNVATLAAAIDTAITARSGSLLAAAALSGLDAVGSSARARIENRLSVLVHRQIPEIGQLRRALADRRSKLEEERRTEPEWSRRLADELDRIGDDGFDELIARLRAIRQDALSTLDNAGHLEANAFTSSVINRVHDAYAEANRDLKDRVNAALTDVAAGRGLLLDTVRGGSSFRGTAAGLFAEPRPPAGDHSLMQRSADAAASAARKSGMWKAIGALAGVISGLLLAPVTAGISAAVATAAAFATFGVLTGTAAGTAVKMSKELNDLNQVDPEERRRFLRQHVVDALEPNHDEAVRRLRRTIGQLRYNATAALRTALAAAHDDVTGQIEELDRDLRRSEDDARAEADRLGPVLDDLTAVLGRAGDLERRVHALSNRLPVWQDPPNGYAPPAPALPGPSPTPAP